MAIQPHYQGQTGPKTIAGKRRSSMNALKTGIFAKTPVLPFEDEGEYRRHIKAIMQSLQPEDALQESIAQQIADSLWRGTRQELRASIQHNEMFKGLRPDVLARMLNLSENQVQYAPEFILNPKTRFTRSQLKEANALHAQFLQWQNQTKEITNHQLLWGSYQGLFKALDHWLGAGAVPPLLMATGQGLSLAWQQEPKKLEECMIAFGYHLWYIIHFKQLRPQLRNWMAMWYLVQGAHARQLDTCDEVVLKEQRTCQSLLDTFFRLRKSQAEHVLMRHVSGVIRKPNALEGMPTKMAQLDTTGLVA